MGDPIGSEAATNETTYAGVYNAFATAREKIKKQVEALSDCTKGTTGKALDIFLHNHVPRLDREGRQAS